MANTPLNPDLLKDRLLQGVERCVVELTANLLRVTRGAGRPVEVGPQAVRLADALQTFYDQLGYWPYAELAQALRLNSERTPSRTEREDAIRSIVAGAIQFAASDLLDQRVQLIAGERQIGQGVDRLLELHLAQRREEEVRQATQRETAIAATMKQIRRKAKATGER